MTELSTKLIELRRERLWSQEDLGRALNVTQKTISRLERSGKPITNMRLLAPIAALLACSVAELLPKEIFPATEKIVFLAFCPNAFCAFNTPVRMPDGKRAVQWTSARMRPLSDFDLANFCWHCRSRLVKGCPACQALIEVAGGRYCPSCGGVVFGGPSDEEWEKIERILEEKEAAMGEEERWGELWHDEGDEA